MTDHPITALYDEWLAIRDRPWANEAEAETNLDRMNEVERAITATPANDYAGLLAKARIAEYTQNEGGKPLRHGEFDESRDTLGSLVRDLERMAGGAI